jgi:hypothetical protein
VFAEAAQLFDRQAHVLASVLSLVESLWRESSLFGRYVTVVKTLRSSEYVSIS